MPSGSTDAFGRQGSGTAAPTNDTRPPAGPALDDPLTRTSLKRYRWRGRSITLVGTALLVAFFVVVSIQSGHAKWLLEHGAQTLGRITQVSRTVHGGSFRVYYIAAGRPWEGTIALTESSGFYAPGERVTVIYDPRHPSDIRTPEEKNEPQATTGPLILALVIGLLLLVGGTVTLERGRRWRRLLATSPWQPYRARYLGRVMRGRAQPLNPGLEVAPVDSPSGTPTVLRMASTWSWRTDRMRKHDGQTIWLAGDPAKKVVIGLPVGRELLAAGPPRAGVANSYQRAASQPPQTPVQVKKARRSLLRILAVQWVLFTAVLLWTTHASALGIGIAVVYGLTLVPVAVVVVRAQQKAGAQRHE